MFNAPVKEPPKTIYNTPHLFLFRGTGFEKETLALLNKLRSSGVSGVSYVRADDVLHEEFNRNFDKYQLGLRERSASALKKKDHSIIVGAIDRAPNPEYGNQWSVSDFLVGDAVNEKEMSAQSLRFCLDEKLPQFLERQRRRNQQNGWNYDDVEFTKWYNATRPGQVRHVHPLDKEIVIPVGSVDETVARIWSYLPLK